MLAPTLRGIVVLAASGAAGLLASARSTQACRLEGKDVFVTVAVSPAQQKPFRLSIQGWPVIADLGDSSRSLTDASLAVDGVLSLRGTAPLPSISVNLSRAIIAAGGVVRLAAGRSADLIAPAPGDSVAVRVKLNYDAWIPRLSIPCDALTLDDIELVEDIDSSNRDADWLPRRNTLVFRPRPDSREGLLVTIKDRSHFELAQIESVGDWLRVAWREESGWGKGASLSGWVSKRDVRSMPNWGRGASGLGGHRTKRPRCAVPKYAYRGPADIKPGTGVYAQPGIGAWATVNDSGGVVVAARHLDDDWVALVELPGITPVAKCDDLEHAWVPRSAVTIPPKLPDSGGTWRETRAYPGPARTSFATTLLPGGLILMTGGWIENQGYVATVSSFDPVTGVWKETMPLASPRGDHTATPLPDGRVLIVGGSTQQSLNGSAEIYDPRASRSRIIKPPHTPRAGHAAVTLRDGRVLIVGGTDASGKPIANAELFDPTRDEWILAGTLSAPRSQHTATVLSDGRVLVVGGAREQPSWWDMGILSSAEIFDPAKLVWRQTRSMLGSGQSHHTASLLPDGKVLVAGGLIDTGMDVTATTSRAQVFDPNTENWTPEGDCDPAHPYFDRRPFSRSDRGQGRYGHTATVLADGRPLLIGGGPSLKPIVFDPKARRWSFAGAMVVPRRFHSATLLPDRRVVVVGGYVEDPVSSQSHLTQSVEIYGP